MSSTPQRNQVTCSRRNITTANQNNWVGMTLGSNQNKKLCKVLAAAVPSAKYYNETDTQGNVPQEEKLLIQNKQEDAVNTTSNQQQIPSDRLHLLNAISATYMYYHLSQATSTGALPPSGTEARLLQCTSHRGLTNKRNNRSRPNRIMLSYYISHKSLRLEEATPPLKLLFRCRKI